MRTRLVISTWILVGGLGCVAIDAAWAQVAPERLVAIRTTMEQVKSSLQQLPEEKQRALSGAARNLLHLAETWTRIEGSLAQTPAGPIVAPGPRDVLVSIPTISDPSKDFVLARMAGFTQSETSGAWCGTNAAVGYNDSGSFLETLRLAGIGLSFNGLARSVNGGLTFTDLGFLPPGPTTSDMLSGDPVLACTDANTFYYASLFERATTSNISVSKSTNGGATFGNPVSAVGKNSTNQNGSAAHFLDKEWLAVDPTNPSSLFVTYTDFDTTGTSPKCGQASRTAIELVRSVDGGATWSAPLILEEVCGQPFVQGSQVVVGHDGVVYTAWETFAADFITRALHFSKSTDHGATFSAPSKVVDVTPVGCRTSGVLQGNVRTFEFPGLAVRNSDNRLAIAWNNGGATTVPDSGCGGYRFSDIMVTLSTDQGASWSAPLKVNNNAAGTDAYQPAIGVDQTIGWTGLCWYDRRNDPLNFRIDRYCTALEFMPTNFRMTAANFPVVVGQDLLINPTYQGDYDTVVTDFTAMNLGFIAVWGDNTRENPDVVGFKYTE